MKKILFLLFLGVLMHSCTEKENPINSEYPNGILVITDPEIADGDWIGWILVHSKDGTYTEMREITRGGSADFGSLKEDFYHLTYFLKLVRANGDPEYFGVTYLDVPVGEIYTITAYQSNYLAPDVTGEFQISIPRDSQIMGAYSSSSNGVISNSSSFLPGQIEIKQGIADNAGSYLAIAYDKSGEFRYHYLTDVYNQENYALDFAEMKPFDKTITVPTSTGGIFDVSSLVDDGQEFRMGHLLTSSRFGNISFNTEYKIGFLDNIDLYRINLGYSIGNSSYLYTKVGLAPSSINFPEIPNLENGDFDPSNFNYQLPSWATSYQIIYHFEFLENDHYQFITHAVFGNLKNFTLEMPEELKNRIPVFGREDFDFSSTRVNIRKTSFTYQEEIQNNLVYGPSRFEFETYQIGQSLR